MSEKFKRVKKAFTYNVMVAGASGLGKTTFLKSLFDDVVPASELAPQQPGDEDDIKVYQKEVDLGRRKVVLSLIDTPGLGDLQENHQTVRMLRNYVEKQFKIFLKEEARIQRDNKFLDPRVHAIVYFISPNGHCLSQIDIDFINQVGKMANVILAIGKADSLAVDELLAFKKKVMQQVEDENLPIFDFPYTSDLDEDVIKANNALEAMLPFSIVSSDKVVSVNGQSVRARTYKWGVVEVENPDHSDYARVRSMLFDTHLEDLKDLTNDVHYESYRKTDLIKQGHRDSSVIPADLDLAEHADDGDDGEHTAHVRKSKSKRKRAAAAAAAATEGDAVAV